MIANCRHESPPSRDKSDVGHGVCGQCLQEACADGVRQRALGADRTDGVRRMLCFARNVVRASGGGGRSSYGMWKTSTFANTEWVIRL